MIGKIKSLKLYAIIFVFAAFMPGCNSSVSTGDSNKVAETGAEEVAVKTLLSFNQAVQKGDFKEFHQKEVADSAKAELTAEKLNAAFAEFITNKIDISPKDDATITWSPPEIAAEFLNLSGSYPGANGKTIDFKLQYVKESRGWSLKSIDVKTI